MSGPIFMPAFVRSVLDKERAVVRSWFCVVAIGLLLDSVHGQALPTFSPAISHDPGTTIAPSSLSVARAPSLGLDTTVLVNFPTSRTAKYLNAASFLPSGYNDAGSRSLATHQDVVTSLHHLSTPTVPGLLAHAPSSGRLTIQYVLPDNTCSEPATLGYRNGVTAIVVTDIEGDGFLEGVVAHEGGFSIVRSAPTTSGWELSTPFLSLPTILVAGESPRDLVAMEWDGIGGRNDIAILAPNGRIEIWRNVDTSPQPWDIGVVTRWSMMVAGDFNGINGEELMGVNALTDELEWWSTRTGVRIPGVTALAVAPINVSGSAPRNDALIIASASSPLRAMQVFSAAGSYLGHSLHQIDSGRVGQVHLLVADLQRDGHPEVCYLHGDQIVWINNDPSSGLAPVGVADDMLPAPLAQIGAIDTADFNRDGLIDAAVANGAGLEVWLGDGNGNFVLGGRFPGALGVDHLEVYDAGAGPLALLLTRGRRFWFTQWDPAAVGGAGGPGRRFCEQTLPEQVDQVERADLNGDGFEEPVALSGGRLYALTSSGSSLIAGAAITQATRFCVGDFDLDGDPDVATVRPGSGSQPGNPALSSFDLEVFSNDGFGALTLIRTETVGGSEFSMSRDVTGDGRPDIVCAVLGDLWVLPSAGPLAWGGRQVFSGGSGTDLGALFLVDLDDDGDLDVFSESQVAFLNDGSGAFTNQPLSLFPNGWVDMAADDVDGDADVDLLAVDAASKLAVVRGGVGPPPYGGTGDDLSLLSGHPGTSNEVWSKFVAAGSVLELTLISTGGALDFSPWLIAAEVTASPVEAFPSIWLNPAAMSILAGVGSSGFWTPILLPGGVSASFLTPPGLAGVTVAFQGAVVTPLASNGAYATTTAHVLHFR